MSSLGEALLSFRNNKTTANNGNLTIQRPISGNQRRYITISLTPTQRSKAESTPNTTLEPTIRMVNKSTVDASSSHQNGQQVDASSSHHLSILLAALNPKCTIKSPPFDYNRAYVQCTFRYLDPELCRTGQKADRNDACTFGVARTTEKSAISKQKKKIL